MSTIQLLTAPDNTNGGTFYAWAKPLSAAFATFGWIQQADTGQIVWPASIVNIVSVVANGSTAIFNYTLLQGAILRIGNSISVTGCTTTTLNSDGPYKITDLASNTFTVATTRTVTETEVAGHAFGGVNIQVSITNAIGNGTSNTYTYTNVDGVLLAGQKVVISGSAPILGSPAAGIFDGTYTIASVTAPAGSPPTQTFTTTSAGAITHISVAQSATGVVTANSVVWTAAGGPATATSMPPSVGNTLYEIWKMNDGNSLPVYVKLQMGTSNANNPPNINLSISAGTATDGAGNLVGGTASSSITSLVGGSASQSTSLFNSFLSGSTNRILMDVWHGTTTQSYRGFFSIERSHNSAGVDTSEYVTLVAIQGVASSAPTNYQVSFNAITSTTAETKLACITEHGTGTGSFEGSTLLSPVFPVIGAVGNPMTGTLVGKSADWTDLTLFFFTLYNTAHTYQVLNTTMLNIAGASITYDASGTPCLLYRYE